MNIYAVCLLAAVSASAPAADRSASVYTPSEPFTVNYRGQSPGYDEDPMLNQPPLYSSPASPLNWFNGPAPLTYDPFNQTAPINGSPLGYSYGVNGPQPYRFGWTSRYDVAYLPKSGTSSALGFGSMGIFEFNSEWEYSTPLSGGMSGWILSVTPQFNLRNWDGPTTGPFPGLPSNVYRFGGDFELSTPASGPWGMQLAFNPSINTDFNRSLTRNAWNLDGRGIVFYRYSPQLTLALGAGYWDRVRDRVVPYAGVVWTPDDKWEFRLIFPQPRISYFIGIHDGFAKWLYVSGEYHVESYQVELQPVNTRDQVEISDWRLMTGLRMERGGISMFVEGGVVLGREVEFRNATAGDFDLDAGFLGRIGIRF